MSEYLHQKGYIYPLGKLSDEENNSFYKKIKEEENFELDKDKFELEYMGKNDYLLWLTYSTYGEETGEFGSSRPCNQQEIYYHAPKFRDILGEIDTKKLKFIDFCYYNSTECTVDYYLGEEEYKPMTLTEAIQHCKDVANIQHTCNKEEQRKCSKEHQQLATWLQKLADYEDKTYIEAEWLEKNGFERQNYDTFLYCNDAEEISARIVDTEVGIWEILITFLDHGVIEELNICTLGQFRMFLAICGLDNLVNEFKA